jgi:hypothetical protein
MVRKLGFEVKIGEEGIRQMRLPLR